jgi:hypothetical protein
LRRAARPPVLASFRIRGYPARMTDAEQFTPAKPDDIAEAIAFALRYSGRKRVNDAVLSELGHEKMKLGHLGDCVRIMVRGGSR